MNLKRLIILGLLTVSGICNAQTNFRPGYVIKTIGDTLFGEIDSRGDLTMGEVCRFRNNKENEEKYSPNEITAYRFDNSKYYVSKEVNGKKVFLEFLLKGKISIYYLRDKGGDHYFLDKEGIGISELKYEAEIREKDGFKYNYTSKYHFGILNYYMQDVPDFKSRIAEVTVPDHRNLMKLAEEYNQKVCDDACIVYEKKMPFIKCNLEIVGGSVNYPATKDHGSTSCFQGGALAHLWMPRTNENLYFRTGIIFSDPDPSKIDPNATSKQEAIVKIPLQLEYIYPKGKFVPKIAVGVNLYKHFYAFYSLMGGFNIAVSKKVGIGANFDIDFFDNNQTRISMVPRYTFSKAFLAGLYIKL